MLLTIYVIVLARNNGHLKAGLGIRSFALLILSLFCSCRSFKKSDCSNSLLLFFSKRATRAIRSKLKERLEQNEQIALFTFSNTRAIRSLSKSDLIFFLAESYQLGWKKCLTSFKFITLLTSLKKAKKANRSPCSF